MTDNTYLKKDLGDYAEEPTGEVDGYNRTPYLRAILPDEATIEVYSTGGYQGTLGYVIGLDGFYWLIKEMYGSCSYCDGFIDSDKVEYAKSMCRNAYCFDNEADAMHFLTEQAEDGGYGWNRIANHMKKLLQEMEI